MRVKHRVRPLLETLEDRWVPATVRLTGSTLLVSSQNGPLTVTQTALNQFNVHDNATPGTSYSNIASIVITGSNLSDSITLNFGTFQYTGSLTLNTGNGNDVVTITGTGAAVQGNTTILTGLGNDTVNLNSTGAASFRFGGSVTIDATANGTKTLNFGNATSPSTIGGSLTVLGFNTVNLGVSGASVPNVFGGSVTVQDGSLVIPVTVLGADGDSFNSNVTVNTGSNADVVRLRAVTVAGNTSINLGNDTSPLQDFAYLGQFTLFPLSSQVPAVFAGSVSISQGTGMASVRVATALDIGGDFNLSLGEGNNNLVGDSIQPGFNISGSENITCGNGDNNLGLNCACGRQHQHQAGQQRRPRRW